MVENKEIRCKGCNKKLGEDLEGEVRIVCPRCHFHNVFKNNLTNDKKSALLSIEL